MTPRKQTENTNFLTAPQDSKGFAALESEMDDRGIPSVLQVRNRGVFKKLHATSNCSCRMFQLCSERCGCYGFGCQNPNPNI